ncbi:MAG: HD domain-containing protein [Gemmataceae bacterium]|nr:HD domain-containing protein [Gemmataceae bacterium]
MSLLDFCPAGPEWRMPWDALLDEYACLRELHGCPQDPVHHAEGDVGTHTRLVCEELVRLEAWRALDERERRTLFAAAVLHDVAKPECTKREDDGRITSRGHSRKGAIKARGLLWRERVPFEAREEVCGLIAVHQVPYWLIDRPDVRRKAVEASWTTRGDRLALLAEADVRGRICADRQRLLDNVGLFAEQLREMGLPGPPVAVRLGAGAGSVLRRREARAGGRGPRSDALRGGGDVRLAGVGQGPPCPRALRRVGARVAG